MASHANHGHDHSHHDHSHESAAEEQPAAQALPAPPIDLLVIAVKSNNRQMCQAIVESHPEALDGFDSHDGATPAHWAALLGNLPLLEYLADAGAPLDKPVEASGMAPIHWAATRGQVEIVRLLLQRGIDINATDAKHTTALAIASQYDHTVLVFSLVKQRADINILDNCQDSALHWAAYKGNSQTTALLHYLGLPADAADSYGSTPLHLATAQNQGAVVEYLLEVGNGAALMKLKDKKGRTPMAVAKERQLRVVQRLMSAVEPTCMQRAMAMFMGQEGEKVCFVFFWVNSIVTWVSYGLFIVPAEVGPAWQHATFAVTCLLMYVFYLKAFFASPGVVPTEGKPADMYREALELAAEGSIEQAEQIGALCHTCHIARPLRSKHCSVLKRCVSAFDHHCPYVNNTLGANNYISFVTFMFFGLVTISIALLGNAQYLLYEGYSNWIVFQLVDQTVFDIFALMMNPFHWSLMARNMTTNEHMNMGRYPYLRDDLGRFRNAFDAGVLSNFRDVFTRSAQVAADPFVYTERFKALHEGGRESGPAACSSAVATPLLGDASAEDEAV